MLVVANTKAARGLTFDHDNASRDLATNNMQDCLSERTLAERSFDAIYGEGAFSRGYDGKYGRFVEFYVALPNLSNMVIRVDSINQNVAVWKRNTDE